MFKNLFEFKKWVALCACLSLSAAMGCSKQKAPGSSASSTAATEATLQNAFQKSDSEVKALADAVNSDLHSGQTAKAYIGLHDLAAKPGLTLEQQQVVAQSQVKLNSELKTKAAQGDEEASKLLEAYRSGK